MNTGGTPSATAKVGGDQTAPAAAGGKPAANTVNERTYQEVEYLKKNLGPILVAALAEICIRRPADPIEYLGHWLLRWRYNEELKRRDVQNALDVVRQRQWAQVQDETAAAKVEKYADGFTPDQPHGPPGYGGPLSGEELGENGQKEVEEAEFHPPEEVTGEGAEIQGEGGAPPPQHLAGGPPEDFSRKSRKSFQRTSMDEGGERRNSQGLPILPEGEQRRTSLAKEGVAPAASKAQPQPPPPGERKASLEPGQERRASQGQAEKEKRASLAGAPPPVLPSAPAVPAPSASAAAPAPAPSAAAPPPEGERRASLEQPRKNSKAPESIGSAPPTDAGSVGEPPAPGGRKLSDATKQPPPPPPE